MRAHSSQLATSIVGPKWMHFLSLWRLSRARCGAAYALRAYALSLTQLALKRGELGEFSDLTIKMMILSELAQIRQKRERTCRRFSWFALVGSSAKVKFQPLLSCGLRKF